MNEIVEVQFKCDRKGLYTSPPDLVLRCGDYVVVEADRGEDLGRVVQKGDLAQKKRERFGEPAGRVLKLAAKEDRDRLEGLRGREEEARRIFECKVAERGLEMRLVGVEARFDGNKITFYYTAEQRVDFRQLVKDLAAIFRMRIELRQIGVREKARRLQGYGRCGRDLCCAGFLREFVPVTLKAAKDQGLSLNPSNISGLCGRLMCCLMYEREFYIESRTRFPRPGCVFCTNKGYEKVVGVDIFHERVDLQSEGGERRRIGLRDLLREGKEVPRGGRGGSGEAAGKGADG